MDYHAIHGHDRASFDVPPTHRLPTVAASQALDDLTYDGNTRISTGLGALDRALLVGSGPEPSDSRGTARKGGIKRGQVTEIWGPPGSGKTAVGIQLAANAFNDGHGVVWVDCFQNVPDQRVLDVLEHLQESCGIDSQFRNEAQDRELHEFTQYSCESLPHLLALISRPTTTSIPKEAVLLVISGISALVNAGLPRSSDGVTHPKQGKATGTGPTSALKRLQGLQFIINGLQKLAASRNLAVVLLSQCATSIKSEQGASLVPAINATVWEQGVATRVVLFRDWTWHDQTSSSVFLAGLQKIDGRIAQGSIEHISAFNIRATGISAAECLYECEYKYSSLYSYEAAEPDQQLAPPGETSVPITPRSKRRRGTSDPAVIADSEDEDEDFGWADGDADALPPLPSQWQGSEDLILGQDVGLSEDEPEGPDDAATGTRTSTGEETPRSHDGGE